MSMNSAVHISAEKAAAADAAATRYLNGFLDSTVSALSAEKFLRKVK
jgi:ApbE superfamily uncharacterized protein (UPF0280 family)